MRLARNTGNRSEPEIVAPVTMHFSFRLGAELLGIRLVEVDVDDATWQPRIEDVERAITPNTVGLVCSAPGGSFGVLDPIEAFADLARRTGLYLHVDAAFGGFILPFMRDLGHAVPAFDLSLAGVSSISTDGHKLGLMPIATGFFLVKDPARLEVDPDRADVDPHDLVDETREPGSRGMGHPPHLGRDGYRRSTAHVLELADLSPTGVTAIPGMELIAPRTISSWASRRRPIDLEVVHRLMAEDGWGQSYGVTRGQPFIRLSIHPSRDVEHARAFVTAFEDAVARTRRPEPRDAPPARLHGPLERRTRRHDPVHGQLRTTTGTRPGWCGSSTATRTPPDPASNRSSCRRPSTAPGRAGARSCRAARSPRVPVPAGIAGR